MIYIPVAIRRLPKIFALIVLGASLLVLIGWALDIRALQSLIPGHVTMKANTAIGLALSSCALLIAQGRLYHATAGRVCLWLASLIVICLGAGTLAEYVFHVNLGIDQLIFSAPHDASLTPTPGRMAWLTACVFMILGGAFLSIGINKKQGFRIAQPFLLATCALALSAAIGYMYGVIPTVGLGQGIQIAMTTATALILLSAGGLVLAPEEGWVSVFLSKYAGGVLSKNLFPVVILVPFILGAFRLAVTWTTQFSPASVAAMVAVLTMLIFGSIVWFTSNTLNNTDERRQRAERQLAETALAEKHEALTLLESEAAERKSLEAQLHQSQKMEAVGQLAGGIAHDFNNLLTVILSYSELLLREIPADDRRHDEVQSILNAAERAATLTNQLLIFSRKQVIQPQMVDINTTVRNVEKMLRRLIGEDIELITKMDPKLSLVFTDPGQMEQVLVNLAVNARDAMSKGGRLVIETANAELSEKDNKRHIGAAAGKYVMLAVSDTGHGMTEETISHIFDPFFTTKEQGKGTGLGLATVYGIVKQAGGDIWVYSEIDQGTTFKIYLPQSWHEDQAAESEDEAHEVIGGHESVLIVEDEIPLRILSERILESYGYKVVAALDGKEAVDLINEKNIKIDLILTDVVMPGLNGRVIADRSAQARPEIPVLFMSGYTDDEVMRRGITDKTAAFLQKPFTPEQLARKVRQVLDGNKEPSGQS